MNNGSMSDRRNLHCTIILLIVFGFGSLLSTSATGQTSETPDSVRFKTLGVLYRGIGALNSRNVRFKALQDELEEMHPIEPQSMDSTHLATNLVQVAKYLLFLNSHRSQITKDVRLFSDSVRMLEQIVSKEEEKKALADFLSAYKEESAAFIQYSQYLSVMLTDIRKTIVFLQTVPKTLNGKEVTFNADLSANQKYIDFELQISEERTKVDEAIERSIKLTEKENKIIQETLSLFNR